ncbi:polysaccharide deacetylase family protein [Myxacorys almedinensis]|uniref:Polysaccharide deacetylase family protein n=1 Tax=Myxacorys almedinensis A TaxID=2690445 RepID=A0A8J7Z183_9CYAN|nr:polysaccharide deacetylase family protein [Myxacorys almedinensis]NDJ15896.1 polysaccharide deacetylase family protein [Myxacorys almedinensis A]
MRIPGLGKLQRVTDTIKNRLISGGIILMYHRIDEPPNDPCRVCVSPRHFSEQLEVLSRHCRILPLQEMVEMAQARKPLEQTVAITFDDGYADNLLTAKPLLEKYNAPATMFVPTGNWNRNQEFWWDALERVFLQPGHLPQRLRLEISGDVYEWDLGEVADYSEADFERDRTWTIYTAANADPTIRHSIYRSLSRLCFPLPEPERQNLLTQLASWSGIESTTRLTHRSLSPEEVRQLGDGSLIEIGAHTVYHPPLSTLSATLQQQEIQQGKAALETLLGYSISSFAYPYGNYNTQTLDVMRTTDFACACSTKASKVVHTSNCFELPRVEVQNWDGEAFARWFVKWL